MQKNHIEAFHAFNMGPFKKIDIEFNKRFNLLVGSNGCGKTSLMRCVAIIINPRSPNHMRYKDNSEAWIDCSINNKLYRIGVGKGWVEDGNSYRNAKLVNLSKPPGETNRIISTLYSTNKEVDCFAPLILGAYRKVDYKSLEGMKKEKNIVQKRAEYRSNGMGSINGGYLPDIKQWLINRYFMIEKEWAGEYKKNWAWLIKNFNIIGPNESNFKFVKIEKDLEPIFESYDEKCYLEELSAGFQAVLSLILGIFEWIETTNENIDVKEAVGTVFIDEIDVHLHPEWQLTIRDILLKIFPKLQFITTTHSPHVIASAKEGEIILLPRDKDTNIIRPIDKSYAGWSIEQILEEIMDVQNLDNKVYNKLINEAMNSIENNNALKLKLAIEELKKVSHPNDTIIPVLKIKLAKLILEDER